ncbi:hypothetical protein JOF41_002030 [Saccharothrix coeruleofusca]|uniref:VOC family protein n=1 Tax=Saccharothrix coeruleofusca TaxID=33919 RepID=UPI001AE939D8|nr:VOC family protein [Saccharothrix coeruleofusca]MBP2335852.1 hypothetical protein [Saccharothrix coeruleofusca]
MGSDVNGLHHVGHVVRDMAQAMERYRLLGFTVSAPAYPVLPDPAGGSDDLFGVANAHVHFPGNFLELVTVLGENVPSGTRPMVLDVPWDKRARLAAAIRAAAADIRSFLQRFQGVHIVMADTPDIDRVASRLTAEGIGHGGVHAVQRPVDTRAGTRMEPARYLELSGVPEGRLGFAQNAPVRDQRVDHPNGAVGLVGCVLCVADPALSEVTRRYRACFGEARAGVDVVAESALADLLPGESPAALPAFACYAVAVRDLAATERLLRGNGVPATRTGPEEVLVPSSAALGVSIAFRQGR